MTIEELYQQILSGFYALEGAKELLDETVSVTGAKEPEKTLRPENDPPSTVARPEYCVTATLRGVRGEAYTETPEDFRGTLEEALHIPPSEKGISAVTIAALNAAMSCLGLAPGVFPEEEEDRLTLLDTLGHMRFVRDYVMFQPDEKKDGILRMLELTGGDPSSVVVFGDDTNDMVMFDPAFYCVAMGNGSEELKAKADYIAARNLEDGIYRACQEHGWF